MLIIKLGVPTGLQNSLMIISMMVLQRQINEFGVAVMAGRGIESKIESFMLIPLSSIATAVTTFVGQNPGARKDERVLQGLEERPLDGRRRLFHLLVRALLFLRPHSGHLLLQRGGPL